MNRRNISFSLIAALGLALLPATSGAQQTNARQTTKEQFVGTWKVLTLKATTGDKVAYPLGEQVGGYVTITPERIWLLFVDSTRKAPVVPTLTDAESITMMKSHVAWTGKYVTGEQTPEGLRLNSRVDAASSQAISGTERVYFMRLNGNILTMKSPSVIVPMTGQTSIVEFEMVKAD